MADFKLTAGINFEVDYKQFKDATNGVQNAIKNLTPNIIGAQLPEMDITKAQQFADVVKQQSMEVEKVIVKQQYLQNVSDETYSKMTTMTVTATDSAGQLYKQVEKIEEVLTQLPEGVKLGKVTQSEINYGKQAREVNKLYEDRLKKYDALDNKASDWYTRAQTMGDKERNSIQQSTTKIKEQINAL